MSLDKAGEMMSKVVEMLDSVEGVDNGMIAEMVAGMYESLVSKYRPVVGAVPVVIDKAFDDIMPVINAFYAVAAKMREDENFQEIMNRCGKLKAKQRFEQLKLYQGAGFQRKEAMSLLLQDIANIKAGVQNFQDQQTARKSK